MGNTEKVEETLVSFGGGKGMADVRCGYCGRPLSGQSEEIEGRTVCKRCYNIIKKELERSWSWLVSREKVNDLR